MSARTTPLLCIKRYKKARKTQVVFLAFLLSAVHHCRGWSSTLPQTSGIKNGRGNAPPLQMHLFFHPAIQLLHQLPHRLKQQQGDDKIADTMGNIKGNARHPLGSGIGKSADEHIHNAAQSSASTTSSPGTYPALSIALTINDKTSSTPESSGANPPSSPTAVLNPASRRIPLRE